MIRAGAAFLAGCLLLAAAAFAEDTIIGGEEATRADNPFQVAIMRVGVEKPKRAHSCGGSLLTPDTVVTAAHCSVEEGATGTEWTPLDPATREILANTLDLRSKKARNAVKDIIVHPKYDHDTVEYDIAVWKLETPVKNAKLARLPRGDPGPGMMMLVTGWGRSEDDKKLPLLRKISVPVVTLEACDEEYLYFPVTEVMICAGTHEQKKDACKGDSGGPMTYGKGNMTLAGVVSWGGPCTGDPVYGVYARVSHPEIKAFIVEHID